MVVKQLEKMSNPLAGFTEGLIPAKGVLGLLITAVRAPRESTVKLNFFVAQVGSAFNAIIGRPGSLRAAVPICHPLVQFSTSRA